MIVTDVKLLALILKLEGEKKERKKAMKNKLSVIKI